MTNFYPIKFTKDVEKMELFQYYIKIIAQKREYLKDDKGEDLKDENGRKKFKMVPKENFDLFEDRNGIATEGVGSDLTRQILLQCQKDLFAAENKYFVRNMCSIGTRSPNYKKDHSKSILFDSTLYSTQMEQTLYFHLIDCSMNRK
jgi:hypothetical protein